MKISNDVKHSATELKHAFTNLARDEVASMHASSEASIAEWSERPTRHRQGLPGLG